MEQLTTFINDKKKNDKLIMKRFDKFIEPQKDFIDDVWGVIKDYMIEDDKCLLVFQYELCGNRTFINTYYDTLKNDIYYHQFNTQRLLNKRS